MKNIVYTETQKYILKKIDAHTHTYREKKVFQNKKGVKNFFPSLLPPSLSLPNLIISIKYYSNKKKKKL